MLERVITMTRGVITHKVRETANKGDQEEKEAGYKMETENQ